ncbi:unnamed protein product [Paramecium octaurelia]|uniref:Uncharacterized protein n=1 Tax=Paramecium octaurelia TaxID=43137 RepID=A0A8S1ULB6_PAROT|nr:unnamed protein product [Paramecium octaurelia]
MVQIIQQESDSYEVFNFYEDDYLGFKSISQISTQYLGVTVEFNSSKLPTETPIFAVSQIKYEGLAFILICGSFPE